MKISLLIKEVTLAFVLSFIAQSSSFAQNKEIAITIDDLPFVGDYRNFHLNMIISTLAQQKVSATGFIIASEVRPNSWDMLRKFREAGLGLGNHTYSHANLNQLKIKDYMKEIGKADKILLPVLSEPKYFRYPYLAMGTGVKRDKILCYLEQKNYQVAPISVDSKDFVFNQRLLAVPEMDRRAYLEELKPFYLEFIWQQTLNAEAHNQYNHRSDQAQILLIHANLLNAYVLPDILKLYKDKGYNFVNLEDALKTFQAHAQCSNAKNKIETEEKRHTITAMNNESDTGIEDFVDWD